MVEAEETLDPKDWGEIRALGHRMVDDVMDWLSTVRERPAWQTVPPPVRARLTGGELPREGRPLPEVYEAFRRDVLPYPTGNVHPRFWGWVMGTGTPSGALADLLASAMNSSAAGFDDAAPLVEDQVIAWLRELMGFPEEASGLLVTGGSMANLVGLTVARNTQAGADVREEGLAGGPRLTVYGSCETHSSVRKAVELLGLGHRALRLVPVGADWAVDVEALRRQVREDREAGLRPFCVVGNAAAVNTGVSDHLHALADLCAEEGLWFHVDGAFGALAMLSPRLRAQVDGLSRADSLAFDLHKWGWLPYECGVALVRGAEGHRRAFAVTPAYLSALARGTAPGTMRYSEYGVQLSRGFRALKVWMALQEHGVDKLGRLVEQNVAQARRLADLVQATPELRLQAPVPLNVVCFRWVAGPEERLDGWNRELLARLQESGEAVPSHTLIDGRFVLRVAITNHRTTRADIDRFHDAVLRLGREIAARDTRRIA